MSQVRKIWNTPLSLYSIPLLYFVGIWSAKRRTGLFDRAIGFDKQYRPANINSLYENPDVSPAPTEESERREATYKNSLEILPLWIGAVLAANLAGLDDVFLNAASASFIALRVLYNYICMNRRNGKQASLRSATWLASTVIPVVLFIRAANKLKALQPKA
ncbi:unnamed protein product [Somion occarium]|uniref:Glutathione transferase n=1 Tax=Somion occarium TaxID=3059160 RepID=A0ABP1D008_9APHY